MVRACLAAGVVRCDGDHGPTRVSGGLLPLAIMAFAIGFDAGFIGVKAFSDLD